MQPPWPALRAQLLLTVNTLSFYRRFDRLRQRTLHLEGFAEPAALLAELHGPRGDGEHRNAILGALVTCAQAGETDVAAPLLLLALWPGLDAAHCRLRRRFRAEPDLLVSEISERMLRGISTLDLGRVSWVAATLIRNTERDIVRARQKSWREEKCRVALEDLEAIRPLLAQPGADDGVARMAGELHGLIGADAPLVISIAVLGERQQDAAAAFGLSHGAGRKRYQRALRRLRVRFEEIC